MQGVSASGTRSALGPQGQCRPRQGPRAARMGVPVGGGEVPWRQTVTLLHQVIWSATSGSRVAQRNKCDLRLPFPDFLCVKPQLIDIFHCRANNSTYLNQILDCRSLYNIEFYRQCISGSICTLEIYRSHAIYISIFRKIPGHRRVV